MAPDKDHPPMRPSEEASQFDLALASAQGSALAVAVKHMAIFVAHDGREKQEGDYLIGYAVEEAEGLYHLRNGELVWEEPKDENVHLEVVVRDGADGRFIPGLKVFATLIDESGNEVGTHEQPFLWHSWLYHYGRNWKVPADGLYTLRVSFDAPDFPRHDKINGQRYRRGAEVVFMGVKIKTGSK